MLFENILFLALAGVAQWSECWPTNQIVTGSIPIQGTCLGFGPGPQYGVLAQKATTHWCFSPFPSPSLPLSLKINKCIFLNNFIFKVPLFHLSHPIKVSGFACYMVKWHSSKYSHSCCSLLQRHLLKAPHLLIPEHSVWSTTHIVLYPGCFVYLFFIARY